MKKLTTALLGLSALALPATASASVTITNGAVDPIPANNDFQADLAGLGLTHMTTIGASIFLNQNATIRFDYLGSESSFTDTFTGLAITGPIVGVENDSDNFPGGVFIGQGDFLMGSLAGLLNFTGGDAETVGTEGFSIFLPSAAGYTGPTNVFFFGYDDQITRTDDNHDDFIIRATVLPEPGTWAMMLLGFGAVGFTIRRARRTPALPQLA